MLKVMDDKRISLQEQLRRSVQATPPAQPVVPAEATVEPALEPLVPVIASVNPAVIDVSAEAHTKAKRYIYAVVGLLVLLGGLFAFSLAKSLGTAPVKTATSPTLKLHTNSLTSNSEDPTSTTKKTDATTKQINSYENSCADPVTAVTSC